MVLEKNQIAILKNNKSETVEEVCDTERREKREDAPMISYHSPRSILELIGRFYRGKQFV